MIKTIDIREFRKADFDTREKLEEALLLELQEAFAECYGCGDGMEFEEDWAEATIDEFVLLRFEEHGLSLCNEEFPDGEFDGFGGLFPPDYLCAWLAHKVWDSDADIAAHEVRLTGEGAVEYDGAPTNWWKCRVTVDGEVYGLASALVFDEPSEYGIDGGRVSKLFVYTPTAARVFGDALLGYDRRYWTTRPTDSKGEAVLRAVLRRFPVEGGKEAE